MTVRRKGGERTMRFDLGRERLARKWKDLSEAWTQLGEVWSDDVRTQFEKDAWGPLERAVRHCMDQMDQIEPLLRQMADDCGETERWSP